MIQIGCILFEIGTITITATFESLISVNVEIQYYAFKVYGISKEDVKDAPTSSEVMTKFIAFLNEHTNDEDYVVLVSHNGKVCDFPMIMVELERANLTLPSQVHRCLDTLAVM